MNLVFVLLLALVLGARIIQQSTGRVLMVEFSLTTQILRQYYFQLGILAGEMLKSLITVHATK